MKNLLVTDYSLDASVLQYFVIFSLNPLLCLDWQQSKVAQRGIGTVELCKPHSS